MEGRGIIDKLVCFSKIFSKMYRIIGIIYVDREVINNYGLLKCWGKNKFV